MSIFLEGDLVKVRRTTNNGWIDVMTGIVVAPAKEDPWVTHSGCPFVPVIVDGKIMHFRENKIKFVSRN